jgi:hypothetical protein
MSTANSRVSADAVLQSLIVVTSLHDIENMYDA